MYIMKIINEIILCFYLGGAFALYSLLCRHANVSLIPNQQRAMELSNCSKKSFKQMLENSPFAQKFLLFMTILGTAMVISDGIFTPPMTS
jgi:KUP system potassium uptake protein